MNDLEKLKILLPHFIEHGLEHVKTYEEWGTKLLNVGFIDIAERFNEAAKYARKAIEELKSINI